LKVTKKQLTNAVLLLFAAGVFILIGVKTDWESTLQSIRGANLTWLAFALISMLGSHWLRGARWTLLTEPAGYKLNNRRSFYSVMAGYLVNVATSRGGELARCALSSKSEKTPLELLIGTVVTERIVDLIMLLIVCLAALLFQFNYLYGFLDKFIFTPIKSQISPIYIFAIMAIVVIIILTYFFYFRKKTKAHVNEAKGIKAIFQRFAAGLQTIFSLNKPWTFIAYSFGIWIGYWLSTFCVLKSLEVTASLTLLNALSVVIFASIGIAIPLPAGAGVWYAVSLGLQMVYGFEAAASETYGIFTLAFSNLMMIVVGALCYALLYFEMQKLNKNVT
jgi:glycosyltransferase 2 family protein